MKLQAARCTSILKSVTQADLHFRKASKGCLVEKTLESGGQGEIKWQPGPGQWQWEQREEWSESLKKYNLLDSRGIGYRLEEKVGDADDPQSQTTNEWFRELETRRRGKSGGKDVEFSLSEFRVLGRYLG